MKKFLSVISVITILFMSALPAFAVAPTSLPPLPQEPIGVISTHDVVVYGSQSDKTRLFRMAFITGSGGFQTVPDGEYVILKGYGSGDVRISNYELDTVNNTWIQNGTSSSYSSPTAFSTTIMPDGIINSSHDIYDVDGDPFFLLPRTLSAQGVMLEAQKALKAERAELNRTVLTVVLCGVGCLALLISSVVLVKVLRRFLG